MYQKQKLKSVLFINSSILQFFNSSITECVEAMLSGYHLSTINSHTLFKRLSLSWGKIFSESEIQQHEYFTGQVFNDLSIYCISGFGPNKERSKADCLMLLFSY
jgi:hypothetical protein